MISTSNVQTCRVVRALRFENASRTFNRLAILAVGVSLSLVVVGLAVAAPINYGSFSGSTVDYKQVMEDSNSGDALPLFGAPTVTAPVTPGYPAVPCVNCGIPDDSLSFNPVGFNAHAAGAGGNDLTDGQLKFVVDAKQGFAINNLHLSEAGDTTLAGFGSDLTTTSVFASVFVSITQVDDANHAPVNKTLQMAFTADPPKLNPQNQFRLGTDGGGGPVYFKTWSGSLNVDLDQILTDAGVAFDSGTTLVTFNIDNVLTASSQAGTQSTIAKKQFGGVSITVTTSGGGGPDVPEPASLALAAIGVFGLVAARRFRVA
jgi:hypothetical protein